MEQQHRRVLGFLCASTLMISTSVWKAEADGKEAKEMLNTYVTVVSKVYPPAAPVFGAMIKMLDFTGYFGKSADPVGEALKTINNRLNEQQRQINQLSSGLQDLRQGHYGERNWNRFSKLQASRNSLKTIAEKLGAKTADTIGLAGEARAEAALYLDEEMWMWSDQSLKDQTWTNREDKRRAYKAKELTEPDFKAMPTLEYYTSALVVWMATIEYAADGNAAVVRDRYGADLQEHINWLSKRPGYSDLNGEPQSLPEHVMDRVRGGYEPEKYPKQGVCHIWQYIRDDMRRNVEFSDQTITYTAGSANELCNVPARQRNRAPQIERDREREYGLEVMANLATLLTNLRDKGTVRGAVTTSGASSQPNPSLPKPSPSSPKVEPGGRHKAVFEELGFRPGIGNVEDNILYGVQHDGQLIWHRHYIDSRPGQPLHKFAPTRAVGRGWKAGYQGAYPAGQNAIYTVDDSGNLRWHWHTGSSDGSFNWGSPSNNIGTGWTSFREIIPMDSGVIYTILQDGFLRWNKNPHYATNRGSVSGWEPAKEVGWGWHGNKKYFSGGKGVIYVVNQQGQLMWHRHKEYLNPPAVPAGNASNAEKLRWQNSWAESKKVGDGWGEFIHLFSPGQGHIYGVLPNGDLMYYRHLGWATGRYVWNENIKGKIAEGWNGYAYAWARPIAGEAEFVQPK